MVAGSWPSGNTAGGRFGADLITYNAAFSARAKGEHCKRALFLLDRYHPLGCHQCCERSAQRRQALGLLRVAGGCNPPFPFRGRGGLHPLKVTAHGRSRHLSFWRRCRRKVWCQMSFPTMLPSAPGSMIDKAAGTWPFGGDGNSGLAPSVITLVLASVLVRRLSNGCRLLAFLL